MRIKSLSQKHLAILSLLALMLFGVLFLMQDELRRGVTGQQKTTQQQNQSEERKLLTIAQKAIEKLEAEQTKENLTVAQEALDALTTTDSSTKVNLQARIDKIAEIIEENELLAAAETALAVLEQERSQQNWQEAQAAIEQLSDGATKTGLLERLKALQVTTQAQTVTEIQEIILQTPAVEETIVIPEETVASDSAGTTEDSQGKSGDADSSDSGQANSDTTD